MIVTIGRTYGSGGKEIGQQLADRLHIPCYIADAPGLLDEERIAAVRTFAGQGSCVIVGFCADHILAGTPGLIRFFIHSDMVYRSARIAELRGLSREEAAQLALCRDRKRAMIYGYHTKGKWADFSRYDLIVDSGPLGIADTVELLCQFIAMKVMKHRPGWHRHG